MIAMSTEQREGYERESTHYTTCWWATLLNGTTIRATTLDRDIEYPVGSGTWYVSALGYNPTDSESTQDLNPDNMEVEGFLSAPSLTDADIHSGLWDFASVEIFEIDYKLPELGKRIIRKGKLGEVRGGRSKFTAELRGMMQALTRSIVQITTKDCSTDLGSPKCGISLAAWTVNGTVGSVTDNRIILDAGRTEATDWFTGGKLTMTSGACIGLSMEVKRSIVGQLELQQPFYEAIEAGDTYSVYAGCQKRFTEDCKDKFNNVVNFRGFPHLPGSRIYRTGGVTYGDES